MTEDGTQAAVRGRAEVNRFIEAYRSKRRDTAGVHAIAALESFSSISDQQRQRDELRPLPELFQRGGLEDLALCVLGRLAVLEQALGNDTAAASAMIEIGNVYAAMRNLDAARRWRERVLEAALAQNRFGDAASACTDAASFLAQQGDFAAALPRLRRSLELLAKGKHDRTEFITRGLLVQVLDELGSDSDEAFAVARPVFGRLASFASEIREPLAAMLERIAERHHSAQGGGDLAARKAKLLPELWGRS